MLVGVLLQDHHFRLIQPTFLSGWRFNEQLDLMNLSSVLPLFVCIFYSELAVALVAPALRTLLDQEIQSITES